MKYVIVGNSAAGVAAAEAIRSVDKENSLVMVSNENTVPYSRCLTSYYLGHEVSEKGMLIRPEDWYRTFNIETFLGKKAVNLDGGNKILELEDGKEIFFDRLLLATGASPAVIPITGYRSDGVFVLRTMADAKKIALAAEKTKQVVVVGGGLVGLKAAYGLHKRGLSVTVVEYAPQLLPRVLDNVAADMVKKVLEENGIKVMVSTSISEISHHEGKVAGAVLSNGEELNCQMALMATGVKPNIDLAQKASLKTNRGILVDEKMRTSNPDIFAAGDVVETLDLICEENRVNAIWPNAIEQGQVAGYNMAGLDVYYEGSLGMNSAHFFGFNVISAGIVESTGEEKVYTNYIPGKFYRKLVIRNGCLVGMVSAGEITGAGILTGLVKRKAFVEDIFPNLLKHDLDYFKIVNGSRRGSKCAV